MMPAQFGQEAGPTDEEPDAVARGWVARPDGSRQPTLFVLARDSLGVSRTEVAEVAEPPEWVDLRLVRGLDALGDPVDGALEVEMAFDDGRVLHASWPEPFCDRIVNTLLSFTAGTGAPTEPPAPPPVAAAPIPAVPIIPLAQAPQADAAPAGPPFIEVPPPSLFGTDAPAAPAPAAAGMDIRPDRSVRPDDAAPAAPAPPPASPPASPAPPPFAPLPDPDAPAESIPPLPPVMGPEAAPPPVEAPEEHAASTVGEPDMFAAPIAEQDHTQPVGSPPAGSTALVLEDVVYLGGYPGQTKKRKKCTATLTREGLEVTGPSGLSFRVSWDVVRTVETQNADEARFRMNTKVHRDATALVVECQQEVTILLEARDCPTIPLRTAIAQLVVDLRVVVV